MRILFNRTKPIGRVKSPAADRYLRCDAAGPLEDRPFLAGLLVLAWSAFVFGFGIDAGPLYRTESLRAMIGQEALRGSWLTPSLYGEPYLSKPPGMYVAIAAASAPFGKVTTVSARVPSVLAACIIVLLFFATLGRLAGTAWALAGGLLMPICFLWLDRAPSAEIDMLQTAWVAAALLSVFWALEYETDGRRTRAFACWSASLCCVAGGFLTKWTAPAFFYVALTTLLLWQRRLPLLWSRRHLVAAGMALLCCAFWIAAVVEQAGWEPLYRSFMAEAGQRLNTHRRNGYPWREAIGFPLAVLAAHFPWSGLALGAWQPSWQKNGSPEFWRFVQLLHCWVWPNLLFWSVPTQHHIRYCLPITPGLVALGIVVLLSWARISTPPVRFWGRNRVLALAAVLVIWAAIKIGYVEAVVRPRSSMRPVLDSAAALTELVPMGETLYVGQLKDEGILFYYGRPVRRFHAGHFPPRGSYAALIESEWRELASRVERVGSLHDQQGGIIIITRFP